MINLNPQACRPTETEPEGIRRKTGDSFVANFFLHKKLIAELVEIGNCVKFFSLICACTANNLSKADNTLSKRPVAVRTTKTSQGKRSIFKG